MSKQILVAKLCTFIFCTIFVASLSHADELSWSFIYNSAGRIQSSNGPRSDVNDITQYEYDTKGNIAKVINALGHITEFSNFDHLGNPQTIIDPNGASTTLTYSPQGWLTSANTSNGTIRFEHNAVGDITKLIRGDGSLSVYTWDAARRLIRITNSLEEKVEFDLDAMGNPTVVRISDGASNLTKKHRMIYDELGRLRSAIGAAGQTSLLQYDLNDNPTILTNPNNYSHTEAYDSLDRLVKSTDPLNGITQLEYDAQDNLTQVIDPRGVTTRYHYDGLDNLTIMDSPDSGTSTFKYDAGGNLTQQTDARGAITVFTYDALNRLTARLSPAHPELDTRLHYDSTAEGNKGIGRLTAVEDVNGVLNYNYDEQGNITTQVLVPQTKKATRLEKLDYGYDGANQLNKIYYPADFHVEYLRNSAGQIDQVQLRRGTESPINFVSEVAYLPFGPLKSLKWHNGITLQRTYNLDYQLTTQTFANFRKTYTYDAVGNITKIKSDSLDDLSYTYDALNRLTEERSTAKRQIFTYDAVANRTSKTLSTLANNDVQGDALTTYLYGDINNRLIEIDGVPVGNDESGNLINDNAKRQFSYDGQNRLRVVKVDGKIQAQFSYNALGQRTQKTTSQNLTTFLYGLSGELLGETLFDNQGLKLSSQFYIWLDGIPWAA